MKNAYKIHQCLVSVKKDYESEKNELEKATVGLGLGGFIFHHVIIFVLRLTPYIYISVLSTQYSVLYLYHHVLSLITDRSQQKRITDR